MRGTTRRVEEEFSRRIEEESREAL